MWVATGRLAGGTTHRPTGASAPSWGTQGFVSSGLASGKMLNDIKDRIAAVQRQLPAVARISKLGSTGLTDRKRNYSMCNRIFTGTARAQNLAQKGAKFC